MPLRLALSLHAPEDALRSRIMPGNERFRDIRARRRELAGDLGYLRQVLRDGNERAREIASETLRAVRTRMHTDYGG